MKLSKVTALVFLSLSLSLVSCESLIDTVLDNAAERAKEKNYHSPYSGEYFGTYSGTEDSGTLFISISDKDNVTVKRISTQNNFSETFYGIMSGSNITASSQQSNFKVNGALISPNHFYSGTWNIGNGISGTWQIQKQ